MLGHLGIAGKLADFDTEYRQSGGKISDHLLYKGFHRGDINDFECIEIECARFFVTVLAQFVQYCEHGNVSLQRGQ